MHCSTVSNLEGKLSASCLFGSQVKPQASCKEREDQFKVVVPRRSSEVSPKLTQTQSVPEE
uniref:Uncharacterized protein n=1 Tax=Oryza rufipogon TaxID=4529 RepID=A0A679BBC2_ORYRU|nr:hypothetical protein [Oryza rufipogon]BBF90044.1 hypothetical protein [Oryza rufipogon]